MTTHQEYQTRWLRATGERMPMDIQRLPIDRVRFAVEQVEAGHQVFVPREPVRVEAEEGSMVYWDKHREF